MISRQYRAFNSQPTFGRIDKQPYKVIHNYEKFVICQMEDVYKKLMNDDFFQSGIEMMEEKIRESKIELNNAVTAKNELSRYVSVLRQMTADDQDQFTRALYFVERHDSAYIRVKMITDNLKKMQLRMTGMVFYPLVNAMRQIMNFHTLNCNGVLCKLRSEKDFVLCSVLLLILQNTDPNLFPLNGGVSNWHPHNIYHHPIIRLMEEKIDELMYWQRHQNNITPHEIVQKVTVEVFEEYELLYLEWIVINMMSTYLKWNHRYSFPLKTIFSLNGVGCIIYSFLVTEPRMLKLMAKLPVTKKRKYYE